MEQKLIVKIESWTYPGPNQTTGTSYQAHIEDENGAWVQEALARESLEQAQDDARLYRDFLRNRQ